MSRVSRECRLLKEGVGNFERLIHLLIGEVELRELLVGIEDAEVRLSMAKVVVQERLEAIALERKDSPNIYSLPRAQARTWVQGLLEKGYSQVDIAKIVGLPVHRVTYMVKKIRKEEAA